MVMLSPPPAPQVLKIMTCFTGQDKDNDPLSVLNNEKCSTDAMYCVEPVIPPSIHGRLLPFMSTDDSSFSR